jgi:hypothetical protein
LGRLGGGIGAGGDKQVPTLIEEIGGEKGTKIVQIYAFENMSFAVDKYGTVYAWGSNKNNILALSNALSSQK